uniref:PhoLip_ATPase_C domain-containing protein n=1 Tax=Ascaris lumbricoides TaxID=6252 RepID=A0A0M3HMM7_ASCLU
MLILCHSSNATTQFNCGSTTESKCVLACRLSIRQNEALRGYMSHVVPLIADPYDRWMNAIVVSALLMMTEWCYFAAALAPLPSPSRKYYLDAVTTRKIGRCRERLNELCKRHIESSNLQVKQLHENGTVRYCETCECIRPGMPFSTSSLCMRISYLLQLESALGISNPEQAFILYLVWGLLYSTFAFVTDFKFTYFNAPEDRGPFWYTISISYLMCTQLAIWPMVIYSYLIPMNLAFRDRWHERCPFDNLGWRKNLRRVFGPNPLLWLIPTRGAYNCKEE